MGCALHPWPGRSENDATSPIQGFDGGNAPDLALTRWVGSLN